MPCGTPEEGTKNSALWHSRGGDQEQCPVALQRRGPRTVPCGTPEEGTKNSALWHSRGGDQEQCPVALQRRGPRTVPCGTPEEGTKNSALWHSTAHVYLTTLAPFYQHFLCSIGQNIFNPEVGAGSNSLMV